MTSDHSTPEAFFEANPNIEFFDVLVYDLCGIMRGKRVDRKQLRKLYEDGFLMPSSVQLLDVTGESSDPLGRGFSDGDPDYPLLPIDGTLAPVPWVDKHLGQVLVAFYEEDKVTPQYDDPRAVLARTVSKLHDAGLTPVVACELEFYLIDPDRGGGGEPVPPIMPKSGKRSSGTQVYSVHEMDEFAGVLFDIAEACRIQGLPAGPASAEYATGQFEVNLDHVDDPLTACDQSALLQRVIRGVAAKHGLEATFMAKPYPEGSGSGLHIHCSLLDGDGRNIFDDGGEAGTDALRHAVGGLMTTMTEGMAIFAPNRNSYRRFIVDSYVPVGPAWSYNNRSTAIRIPGGSHKARRFEHRVAGADANPYLTMAALLAGVHHGLENKIDPGEPATGNAGSVADPDMPMSWQRGLDRARRAEVLPGYFGELYWERYLQTKQDELNRFNSMISPLEYEWYLLTR